jgi:RimJ/RimL family protein N-acetyltransferase
MNIYYLHIRRADNRDSKSIFLWRNDSETRKMSRNQGLVSWEAHEEWFAGSLLKKGCMIFVIDASIGGQIERAAMLRFDAKNKVNSVEISININPSFRGLHLAPKIVHLGISEIQCLWPEVCWVVAKVKSNNTPSINTFLRCGFEEDIGYICGGFKSFKKKIR